MLYRRLVKFLVLILTLDLGINILVHDYKDKLKKEGKWQNS